MREFGGDGIALLRELENGEDPELIKLIDRCAAHAQGRQDYERMLFGILRARDKVYTETLTVYLLSRLLENG